MDIGQLTVTVRQFPVLAQIDQIYTPIIACPLLKNECRTFRTMDVSYDRRFQPLADFSHFGRFVPWIFTYHPLTFRTKVSYH